MSKNINVEAHVNRYVDTELSEVVKLINGLASLVEKRRSSVIIEMEEKLALLRKGEVPEEAPKPTPTPRARRTRGGKPVADTETDTLA
jgi:hypothetical protein